MLIKYRIKWFFHCLFNFHQQLTIWTADETFVGCFQCNKLNDSEGNEFSTKRVTK